MADLKQKLKSDCGKVIYPLSTPYLEVQHARLAGIDDIFNHPMLHTSESSSIVG
jgi:hypothetical protein